MSKKEINYLKKLVNASEKDIIKLKKAHEEKKTENIEVLKKEISDLQEKIVNELK